MMRGLFPGFGAKLLRARGGFFAMLQTLLAQGATLVVNVGTGVITARMLGPVGRGEFAAACLWLILPALIATSGLRSAVVQTVTASKLAQSVSMGSWLRRLCLCL